MVLGFHSRPSYVAQNFIVGLDFDGTIAYGAHVRVWYAKKFFDVNLTEQQILGETWPRQLGKDKARIVAAGKVTDPVKEFVAKNGDLVEVVENGISWN